MNMKSILKQTIEKTFYKYFYTRKRDVSFPRVIVLRFFRDCAYPVVRSRKQTGVTNTSTSINPVQSNELELVRAAYRVHANDLAL